MDKTFKLLLHPKELLAVYQLKCIRKPLHPVNAKTQSETLIRCYELLKITSRSFAAVIKELHPELRDAVMLFYLILRALDTVEDDMTIEPNVKVPLLRSFHEKLNLEKWSFDGNSKDEKDRCVLVEFDKVLIEYHKLRPEYQEIILDITDKMGNGMADYILDEKFNTSGVDSVKDYDLYCHYVAGLVGEGLTKLMILAKFSDQSLSNDNFQKSESMGLFLQKTNIIRDYHEDLEDGRSFWPKEIWSKYTSHLPSFYEDASIESQTKGLECINDLVLNALGHVKDVLTYLSLVKDPSCFNFCAIPQVMAIATLANVYNNPKVLHGVVKIRKGTTAKLILDSRTLPNVVKIFRHYIEVINHKSSVQDPNYLKIGIKCGEIEQFCELMYPTKGSIPAGVKKTPTEINKNIIARQQIDDQVKYAIQFEKLKSYTSIIGFVVMILSLKFIYN
ncbi:uncharacterized protein PRCAT00003394001 [Priceomyces carsonii]|uniref:uncharacterized protein n=1 Tax=Priceomyces carsonii TaxID=28549 RepID=UPI002ED8F494|nr:unnamed protein product [Priceomyces carsonii]